VYLTPEHFEAFLDRVGQTLGWRQASACPCTNPLSGAADPACRFCRGKRYVWAGPIQGTAGLSGQKIQQQWAQFGKWEAGDVVISIGSNSPLYGIGLYDRVTFLNDSQGFSLVLTQGVNDELFGTILSIDRVYWLAADEHGVKQQVEGSEPIIAEDGTLSWDINAVAPPTGSPYTIEGRRCSEYFVFYDYPQDRSHQHGSPLPRRVVLRRFDLYGR